MAFRQRGNAWETVVQLELGIYQYKFVRDGKWFNDPANPARSPDGYGGWNSIIEISP